MSILNDADYSSRLNSSKNNSLASNLLSRKRKREADAASSSPRLVKATANPLKKSASESVLDARPQLLSSNPPKPAPSTFVIKSVENDNAQSFRIISTLSRSRLPLTYIDNSNTTTRLFAANLPQLEGDNQTTPQILVARQEHQLDGALYAVERVGSNVYALCRLAEWLKQSDIENLSSSEIVTTHWPNEKSVADTDSQAEWWKKLAINPPVASAPSPRKAPRLSLCRLDPHPIQPEPELDPTPQTDPVPAPVEDIPVESIEDVFTKFISQYLDTLYLSKTPLGFFTKGPLSRARAAFTGGHIQGASLPGLVQFLRTMVHSSSTADKKYRDKLPELLKELPPQDPDADKSPAAKKKRRRKKLKPDKNGMLPEEGDYFGKWWYQDDGTAPSDETAEQSLRRRATQLRTRETFMQVVLILEVLSLEALPEYKDASETATKPKSKKADQLTLSLELLVDKLCIWHSLDTTDLLLESTKADKNTNEGANQLRSFCIEVIIPFYMSRIPEHASSVNKKLGGPSTSSTTSKSKSASHKLVDDVKPGTDKKTRRSLQRVATETQPQPAKTPRSFSRSATDSQVSIKRETTPSLPLSAIPPRRDSQPSMVRRGGPLEKHRLHQREVDFGAIAAANEAKAKKRQEVEQKLKDAISTLKKPSRAAVASEFADVLEQRKRMAEARARTSTSKKGGSSAAQVTATPAHRNKTTAIAATPHHIPAPSFVRPSVLSSGPSLVPSSTIKPKALSFAHFPPVDEESDDDAIPATDHRPRHRNALAETPSKPKVMFASLPGASPDEDDEHVEQRERDNESPLRESPTLLRTPSKPKRPWISVTPSKPVAAMQLGKEKGKQSVNLAVTPMKSIAAGSSAKVAATPVKDVAATPMKNAVGEDDFDKGVQSENTAKQTQGQSLYDALGWNDDFDD